MTKVLKIKKQFPNKFLLVNYFQICKFKISEEILPVISAFCLFLNLLYFKEFSYLLSPIINDNSFHSSA